MQLTKQEFEKYTKFCDRINKHLDDSGYKSFKANYNFSAEYFQGFTDDQILEHYKIADYLHSRVLHESLNWYLGGLFKDTPLEQIEELYLTEEPSVNGRQKVKNTNKNELRFLDKPGDLANLEFATYLDERLIEELSEIIPGFGKESISFLDPWLIGDEARVNLKKENRVKTGVINITENN